MKKAILLLAVIGLSVSLSAQSLADLARNERVRRESFRGRHAVVISNLDLMRVQKLPGVVVAYPDTEAGGIPDAEEAAASKLPPGESDASKAQALPGESPSGTVSLEEPSPVPGAVPNVAIQAQLSAARDLVDLLKTKMDSLRQKYEYQDAMVPGYVIQGQLAEAEKRLVKAQAQLARIEAQARGGGAR